VIATLVYTSAQKVRIETIVVNLKFTTPLRRNFYSKSIGGEQIFGLSITSIQKRLMWGTRRKQIEENGYRCFHKKHYDVTFTVILQCTFVRSYKSQFRSSYFESSFGCSWSDRISFLLPRLCCDLCLLSFR
jgi:hypothetical protein